MAEAFLGELRMMSFVYAPRDWALCNGQLLPIAQNQGLFSLLGTTYGGDGRVNFALPDLRSRVPIHVGGGHTLGERGGEQWHALVPSEMPQHSHGLAASSAVATVAAPTDNLLASAPNAYRAQDQDLTALDPASVSPSGNSQPHQNMQPFLTLSWCIALRGTFPSAT